MMTSQAHEELVRIAVIDSHTGGMPTRVVTAGFPELHGGTVAARRADLQRRFARLTRAVVAPPRGHEALVGALLVPPDSADAHTGVVFFDQSGVIGMCGHGAIGLAHTLRAHGRIGAGRHRLDTPVGAVAIECLADGRVAVAYVAERTPPSAPGEIWALTMRWHDPATGADLPDYDQSQVDVQAQRARADMAEREAQAAQRRIAELEERLQLRR